jgi:hypothetical protein
VDGAEYHRRYSPNLDVLRAGQAAAIHRHSATTNSVIPVGGKPKPPCLGLYVYGTAYEKNVSDSYISSPKQVCLTKY